MYMNMNIDLTLHFVICFFFTFLLKLFEKKGYLKTTVNFYLLYKLLDIYKHIMWVCVLFFFVFKINNEQYMLTQTEKHHRIFTRKELFFFFLYYYVSSNNKAE